MAPKIDLKDFAAIDYRSLQQSGEISAHDAEVLRAFDLDHDGRLDAAELDAFDGARDRAVAFDKLADQGVKTALLAALGAPSQLARTKNLDKMPAEVRAALYETLTSSDRFEQLAPEVQALFARERLADIRTVGRAIVTHILTIRLEQQRGQFAELKATWGQCAQVLADPAATPEQKKQQLASVMVKAQVFGAEDFLDLLNQVDPNLGIGTRLHKSFADGDAAAALSIMQECASYRVAQSPVGVTGYERVDVQKYEDQQRAAVARLMGDWGQIVLNRMQRPDDMTNFHVLQNVVSHPEQVDPLDLDLIAVIIQDQFGYVPGVSKAVTPLEQGIERELRAEKRGAAGREVALTVGVTAVALACAFVPGAQFVGPVLENGLIARDLYKRLVAAQLYGALEVGGVALGDEASEKVHELQISLLFSAVGYVAGKAAGRALAKLLDKTLSASMERLAEVLVNEKVADREIVQSLTRILTQAGMSEQSILEKIPAIVGEKLGKRMASLAKDEVRNLVIGTLRQEENRRHPIGR
jgi:hypothetical protein